MRLRSRILAALGVVILAGLALLVVIGAQVSDFWATHIWAGGFINNTATLAPFPAFSSVEVFSLDDPNFHQVHYYLLGSDAGGRDLFALVAKGALPSVLLVALALAGRMLIGVVAGFGIASGATLFRSAARAAGGWIAGFPYLALAVLVIQAFTGGPSTIAQPGLARTLAFVIAISIVGWRDVARSEEHTSELQSPYDLVCRLLLEKKKKRKPHDKTRAETTCIDRLDQEIACAQRLEQRTQPSKADSQPGAEQMTSSAAQRQYNPST